MSWGIWSQFSMYGGNKPNKLGDLVTFIFMSIEHCFFSAKGINFHMAVFQHSTSRLSELDCIIFLF